MSMVWMVLIVALGLLLGVPALRRTWVTQPLMAWFRRTLPPMSRSEQAAIESGTVGFEAQLFGGRPDYRGLAELRTEALSDEERTFLNVETEHLCAMLDEWRISQQRDMPPEVWSFIKQRGFFGLIIPKHYGGLGFSASAQAAIVTKIASRSATAATTVMVPNSLGPGELLLRYGTDEQKNRYLPRLASGEEIPCFALTNPWAGSDAGSIPDTGRVVRELRNGVETLGFRITWSKRYITLGPVATLLGLAFRAVDPDHLLGPDSDLGITCALIPASHPEVRIGRRHAPLTASFMNGPNEGDEVFVPFDWVIGGRAQIGNGWAMLMECLAAGRGISLPSLGIATQMLTLRSVGAYAMLRRQFGLPIGRFHGVAQPLGDVAARLYAQDGARRLLYAELDRGERPAVASAILKYHLTEAARDAVNVGMDVLGGKGICVGPRNFLAQAYQTIPIAITVEGANIMTRSLIIFGQGAVRCHPFVQQEMAAAQADDVVEFDRLLLRHLRRWAGNAARGLGLARLPAPPPHDARVADLWRAVNRLSARFAVTADAAMAMLGASLKRLELQSARLGDVLSHLYVACGALQRWELEGRQADDLDLARLAAQRELHEAYQALQAFFDNAPLRLRMLRRLVMPTGIAVPAPDDEQWLDAAETVCAPGAARDRLTRAMYLPRAAGSREPLAQIERALALSVDLAEIDRDLQRIGSHDHAARDAYLAALSPQQHADWQQREQLVEQIIAVDDFAPDELAAPQVRPFPAVRASAQRPSVVAM
ncbi:MAG: acyl-CoA dehydrogenase [Burkholderiaceae bacterium]